MIQKSHTDTRTSGYIISPAQDIILLILSPLIGLVLAAPFLHPTFLTTFFNQTYQISTEGDAKSLIVIMIDMLIMAHLFIVFFRSHGNKEIFVLHPIRFIYIPLGCIVLFTFSHVAAVTAAILAIWWDVYHSSLQTFGLGRIYDMKAGNQPTQGRRLDYLLNILLYMGPIFAGASLMPHLEEFYLYNDVSLPELANLADRIFHFQPEITNIVYWVGTPFVIYYLYSYWRFWQQGYHISWQKVTLLASTATCSILAWGMNSFGAAFFIMNFFHAVQYFAIVWHFEKKTICNTFQTKRLGLGRKTGFVLFLLTSFGYGLWTQDIVDTIGLAFAVSITISLMHFWYDGFIWSVRKKQV